MNHVAFQGKHLTVSDAFHSMLSLRFPGWDLFEHYLAADKHLTNLRRSKRWRNPELALAKRLRAIEARKERYLLESELMAPDHGVFAIRPREGEMSEETDLAARFFKQITMLNDAIPRCSQCGCNWPKKYVENGLCPQCRDRNAKRSPSGESK